MALDIAGLLQLDSGSSAVDSTNANERNRQFNRILVALEALGAAFETSFIGGAASKAYTPIITASTGTFTSVAATGRFLTVGKFTWVSMTIIITTNGTAAGSVVAPLPVAATTPTPSAHAVLAGRATQVSGKMLQGRILSGESSMSIFNYDNTYPGSSGEILLMSGWYENA